MIYEINVGLLILMIFWLGLRECYYIVTKKIRPEDEPTIYPDCSEFWERWERIKTQNKEDKS